MILHLMHDNFFSNSFIKYVSNEFDNNNHKFCIITKNHQLKYIEKDLQKLSNIEIINVNTKFGRVFQGLFHSRMKQLINESTKIFIHYLGNWHINFVGKYATTQKLYWIVYGADLYQYIGMELLEEDTKQLIKPRQNLKKKCIEIFYKNKREKLISKLDYACIVFDGDYEVLKQHFNTNAKHIKFCFPEIKSKANDNDHNNGKQTILTKVDKSKFMVLLGNSADPSNNHASIIKRLGLFTRKDFYVICPLSYGDKEYAAQLIKLGKSVLGNRFIPLRKFMPKEDYNELLSSVDVGIFNHYLQQAGGNINYLLSKNIKIYMRDTSIYRLHRANGVRINKIEELSEDTIFDNLNIDINYSKPKVNIYELYSKLFQ